MSLMFYPQNFVYQFVKFFFYFLSEVNVEYRDGLSVFSVPLPSRKESCEFVLKPVSHTVKDFVKFLQEEDKGIDRAAIYTEGKLEVFL